MDGQQLADYLQQYCKSDPCPVLFCLFPPPVLSPPPVFLPPSLSAHLLLAWCAKYLGEKYDCRLEPPAGGPNAWSTLAGYDASSSSSQEAQPNSGWKQAVLAGSAAALNLGELQPQATPPIRRQVRGCATTTIQSHPTKTGELSRIRSQLDLLSRIHFRAT